MPNNLSSDARAFYEDFLKRPDVQARPGLKKWIEDLLAGRKPKERRPGAVMASALPEAHKLLKQMGYPLQEGGEDYFGDIDDNWGEYVWDADVEDAPHPF